VADALLPVTAGLSPRTCHRGPVAAGLSLQVCHRGPDTARRWCRTAQLRLLARPGPSLARRARCRLVPRESPNRHP